MSAERDAARLAEVRADMERANVRARQQAGQRKRISLLEACINTAAGFIVALVVLRVLNWLYGIEMDNAVALQYTAVFTAVSILRGYVLRRIFNHFQIGK